MKLDEGDYVYECDACKEWFNVWEMAYIGPKDRNDTSCNPFTEWSNLCLDCEEERSEER
jgi:hypothetical protein